MSYVCGNEAKINTRVFNVRAKNKKGLKVSFNVFVGIKSRLELQLLKLL